MTSTYKIDYLMLNVSRNTKGDCAIVLKVDTSTTPPTICSTVLIDGGYTGKMSYLIHNTMRRIKASYQVEDLRFDAIVISHWDQVSTASRTPS